MKGLFSGMTFHVAFGVLLAFVGKAILNKVLPATFQI